VEKSSNLKEYIGQQTTPYLNLLLDLGVAGNYAEILIMQELLRRDAVIR